MEIEKLIFALEEPLSHLKSSQSSGWAQMYAEEIIEKLESEIRKVKESQQIDVKLLGLLFVPTGALQEISIDNGWGTEFHKIAETVDHFTDDE